MHRVCTKFGDLPSVTEKFAALVRAEDEINVFAGLKSLVKDAFVVMLRGPD
jgi:hypothetical protein